MTLRGKKNTSNHRVRMGEGRISAFIPHVWLTAAIWLFALDFTVKPCLITEAKIARSVLTDWLCPCGLKVKETFWTSWKCVCVFVCGRAGGFYKCVTVQFHKRMPFENRKTHKNTDTSERNWKIPEPYTCPTPLLAKQRLRIDTWLALIIYDCARCILNKCGTFLDLSKS